MDIGHLELVLFYWPIGTRWVAWLVLHHPPSLSQTVFLGTHFRLDWQGAQANFSFPTPLYCDVERTTSSWRLVSAVVLANLDIGTPLSVNKLGHWICMRNLFIGINWHSHKQKKDVEITALSGWRSEDLFCYHYNICRIFLKHLYSKAWIRYSVSAVRSSYRAHLKDRHVAATRESTQIKRC